MPDVKYHQSLSRWLTAAVFLLMLGGQFSLERLGIGNPFGPVPERFVVLVIVAALFSGPIYKSLRSVDKGSIPVLQPMLIFFIVLEVSTLWAAPSPGLAESSFDVATMGGCIVLLNCSLRLGRVTTIQTFMALNLIAGLVFAFVGLAAAGDIARIHAFGGGPNVFARITGLGLVAVIYFAMQNVGGPYLLWLAVPLAAATVLSGSRGAMTGGAVALLVLGMTVGTLVWRRLALAAFVAAPVGYYLFGSQLALIGNVVNNRIVRLTFEEHYTAGRFDLYAAAYEMFQARPYLGWGLNGFGAKYGRTWGFTYPHNLELQIAAELGVLGLLAFILTFVVLGRSLITSRLRDANCAAPLAALALLLVASQFSGGYYDSRFMWAYLLMAGSAVLAGGTAGDAAGNAPRTHTCASRRRPAPPARTPG